ncbi:hypothetical protein CL633_04030 [bacterium]|nr:hypothetical protein [bacterium]|tara:strand:+ start:654 stop:1526 length:873 start_codon:yes stop_codon:yes gene_type:complete
MFLIEKIKKFIFSILVITAILTWTAVYYAEAGNKALKVVFFDIGQGDSIFVETPSGHQVLIDGGPSSTVLSKLGRELAFYDRDLDMIILTHPDSDHLNGIVEVLERYNVDLILWTGIEHTTIAYQEFKNLINQKNIKTKIAMSGQIIELGQAVFYILWPSDNLENRTSYNINSTSIVAQLVYGESEFLFMGDAESRIETELIASDFGNLQSDVLKVGHHGSKTSTSLEFLKTIRPKASVISCGLKNKYKHPHENTLQNLQSINTKVFRTDLNGDVKMISNGENIHIKTGK